MAEDQWHFMRNGGAEGPISQSELQNRAQSGALGHTDLIWQDGFPEWVQAGTIKGLFGGPPPPPKLPPAIMPSANNSTTNQANSVANRRMIAQLREDSADLQVMLAEMMRVVVRLNPVNIQIYNFLGFINQVTTTTPRHEIARLVQEALQQVDLANAAPMLDQALDGITTVGPNMVNSYTSDLLAVWPEAKQIIAHRWLDDPTKEGENLRQQLRRAVQVHRQDLVVMQDKFRQLQEFHPRYRAIMTHNSIWEYVLGFAAGFFGGGE